MEGQKFSASQIAAVIILAVVAGSIPTLQPMLLGALLAEGRITAGAMGYAATLEGVGTVLATAIAGAWLPPRRLGLIGVGAVLSVLAANLATIILPSAGIIVARGLSGLGNGIMLWLFISMLARSDLPARLYGFYITGAGILVFLLTLFLGTFAISRFGATAGYAILIGINGLLLVVTRFLPDDFADLDGTGQTATPPAWGLLALCAVGLFLAGIMAFWIYAIPLGVQAGISTQTMQMIISIATGIQILAGLAAITFAAKVSGMQAMTVTSAVALVALLATMMSGSAMIWLPAVLAVAFCWMFAPPFHIAFLDVADPSRRAAIFVGTAQLSGLAIGPLLASAAISAPDFGSARMIAIACFAATLIIATMVLARARGASSAPAEMSV